MVVAADFADGDENAFGHRAAEAVFVTPTTADAEGIIEHSQPITIAPPPQQSSWRWPALLLLVAAAYYTVGVLTLASARHGETAPVLYARLLATGHMAEFVDVTEHRKPPTDEWTTARVWQRFNRLEDRSVFRRIAQDSGKHEAHPPFFFWAMHTALCLGVSDHWSTTVINLPAVLLTGVLVALVTQYATRDRWCAALAASCWFLSPPVMVIGDAVRSPTLFAPLTLLLVWLTVDWVWRPDPSRRVTAWRAAATLALAVLGMLNHFQMATPLAVCGLFLLWRNRRACLFFSAAVVVAAGLFLLIDPYALDSIDFNARINASESFTPGHLAIRFMHVGVGLLHFFGMEPKWTRGLTLAIPLTVGVAWVIGRKRVAADSAAAPPRPLAELGRLSLLLIGVDALLFLTWRLPGHAYGAYYFPGLIVLTPVWVGVALRFVVRTNAVRAALVGVLAVSSVGAAVRVMKQYQVAGEATNAIAAADVICTDFPTIQGIPRIVDDARPEARVIATSRDRLLAAVEPAVRRGERVIIAVDAAYVGPPDALAGYLKDAVADGRLRPQYGLEPFSPDFLLFRTP